ncbi:AlpA family transcriptional regulator [Streptomyces sp. 846.5]|nr:helix-turn-helix domain-containing protein [Streptomyces sp. 846.5]TDT95340.1 AlpA family transcriptional regulator [Streptomyces sp. 846.5]
MTRVNLPQVSAVQRRKLATAQEVADYCGVPLATVYAWSSRGSGPTFIKVGRHLRARWADVERWLDSQTISA